MTVTHSCWNTTKLIRRGPVGGLLAAESAPGGELPGVLAVAIPTDRVHPGWGQNVVPNVG